MRTARAGAPLAIAAALAAAALAPAARASEADVFENKIEPVSGQLYRKAGRFELTPTVNVSFLDPFYSKVFWGAKLGYHLDERWSVHASFATGSSSPSGATSLCLARGCTGAAAQQLYQVPGDIRMMGGGEVALALLYGKINLVGEQVVHLDFSVMGGADWIRFREAIGADAAQAGQVPGDASTLGGHVGLGARIFLSRLLALRAEARWYAYWAAIGNLAAGPGAPPPKQMQNQFFADLGLSFFFPGPRGGP